MALARAYSWVYSGLAILYTRSIVRIVCGGLVLSGVTLTRLPVTAARHWRELGDLGGLVLTSRLLVFGCQSLSAVGGVTWRLGTVATVAACAGDL